MTFLSSVRLWKPFGTSRRRIRSAKRPTPLARSIRPQLEVLEDRIVLSPITVTNLQDSGAGSLRDAVQSADGTSGATINFAPGLHGTITLTSGELDITNSMTINGPGANRLTISGNNASRIFDISNGATANISGLTIANGATVSTGENSLPNGPVDVTALGGGGILNQSGSTLNLSKSVLTNNTATASSNAVDVLGGGLLNEGVATVTSSVFCGNQVAGGGSSAAGPILAIGGSAGGGIDNYGGATLTVNDSTFSDNRATGGDAGIGMGGAIDNNAGYDGSTPSTATINNSIFVGNLAGGGADGGTANGGAIISQGGAVSMSITGSSFFSNKAVGGDDANGETTIGQGLGGGIIDLYGTLQMSNSLLAGNQAVGGNHGTPTTDNPLAGGGSGGGILVALGQGTLNNCNLIGNVAQGGSTDAGPGGSGVGGGIENYWGSTLAVNNCSLLGNIARGGQGGTGNNNVPAGFGIGGGIDASSNPAYGLDSTATITDSVIAGNVAIGSPGGPGGNGGNGMGGGVSVGSNAILGFTDASQLTLADCTVVGNAAIGGKGGSGGNGGNGWGGGLIVYAGSSATLQDSNVEHNFAIGGHKGKGGSDGQGVGGGSYNLGTLTLLGTSVIKHNHASTSDDNSHG